MKSRIYLLSVLTVLTTGAWADNTVMIGSGIKVDGVCDLPCDEGDLCWYSAYVWQVQANHTVLGQPVNGRLRVAAVSHAQPRDSYLKTIQLFVLAPLSTIESRDSNDPTFSLVASSPLHEGGKYCIWSKPSEIGISLSDDEIEIDSDGMYCFTKKSLLNLDKNHGA